MILKTASPLFFIFLVALPFWGSSQSTPFTLTKKVTELHEIPSSTSFSDSEAGSNEDNDDEEDEKRSSIDINLEMMSNAVYQGIPIHDTHSEFRPAAAPSITYTHKTGFYTGASAYFWNGLTAPSKYDLTLGYSHAFDNFTVGASYERWLFTSTSLRARNDLKHCFDANGAYNSDWFSAGMNVDYMTGLFHLFSVTTDAEVHYKGSDLVMADDNWKVGLNAECIFSSAELRIAPAKNSSKTNKKSLLQTTRVACLDLSIPLSWDINRWSIELAPHYALPFKGVGNPNHKQDSTLPPFRYPNQFFAVLGFNYHIPFGHTTN